MPNWMKVQIEASGDTDFDFRRDFKSFNDVVPMPSILQNTTSGSLSWFVEKNYDEGLRWLLKNRENNALMAVARSYRAKQLYGYFDSKNWSDDHWGVKWDMDIVHVDERCIEFDTPWCLPEPVLIALFDKFPDVIFSGEFAEEQAAWLSGCFDSENGMSSVYYDIEYTNEAYERYFAFWGGEEDYDLLDGEYVYRDE